MWSHPTHPDQCTQRPDHNTGNHVPYSLRTVSGFFNVPQRVITNKGCETGPTVYRPYPRRLESLTICRCHCKGSTFSSVIWRPWVLVRLGFEPTTSRTVVRYSANFWTAMALAFEISLPCSVFPMIFLGVGVDILCKWTLWIHIYCIDRSVLLENTPRVKFIRSYIRDPSGVFSISSLVSILMTSSPNDINTTESQWNVFIHIRSVTIYYLFAFFLIYWQFFYGSMYGEVTSRNHQAYSQTETLQCITVDYFARSLGLIWWNDTIVG